MCFIKKEKIIQASKKGLYIGPDKKSSRKELFEIFNNVVETAEKNDNGWVEYNNLFFCIKNITYLGFNKKHCEDRSYKKRAQFPTRLSKSYSENPNNKFFIGIYQNAFDEKLFIIFELSKKNRGKNSSVHVWVEDLQFAFDTGNFSKIDKNSNIIKICAPEHLKSTISNLKSTDPMMNFADYLLKTPEWSAEDCINEMVSSNFRNQKQTEWPGWYTEFLAEKFFKNDKEVKFPETKKIGTWLPDGFYKTPIELKFHNGDKREIPGNDYEGMLQAITEYQSVLLFVVNGEVELESDKLEISLFHSNLFGKTQKHATDFSDSHRKLKKSIKLTEVGYANIDLDTFKKLKEFSQGKNSNGKSRKKKLMFSTDLLSYYGK